VFTRRPARGTKCLFDDGAGRGLFVRHNYGNRRRWELPGGGARPGEPMEEAARREAWEELGADVEEWRVLATTRTFWRGRPEEITVCGARWPGGPIRVDPVEIAVAEWFPLDAPPEPLGPTTVAALAAVSASASPAGSGPAGAAR
jgi:8-oxo-dGTP pyrophosphatase MutT (NUDIX family)